ncbi:ATP-dependent RNA helicase DeaD [Longimicrobium terrae]|uniref:DEAD-box ATP-dependent RNA helicase RhpA n=2 Tax=Longimicrobium terrae TaxID=1639882 RepID=A0A841H2G4_9BACT|nr:DEAD/DEAH box helicase [Longimicrobium terrae]MBB4637915.1 ATP-dependent RNA helicase DeaD [Longimicrobium terrae]MBB6072162.1 ATP-dependent RNA helicase DeaD [Longimicrobium terrae]NNC28411.1 DEAD/DEAH box helicase [Longimicrobium terrae]
MPEDTAPESAPQNTPEPGDAAAPEATPTAQAPAAEAQPADEPVTRESQAEAPASAETPAEAPVSAGAPSEAPAPADVPAVAQNVRPEPPQGPGFVDLGLAPEILVALDALGYEEPTPIQVRAIPVLLAGRDVIGRAATGTGKTAAFALPLVQRIDPSVRGVQALVMAPTRELAVQVAEATQKYGARRGVSVLAVYGGQDITRQLRELRRGVQVVVGTPGRLLDHIRRGSLDLSGTQYVVLDEADEMLDMGFIEDIEAILEQLPKERQTALFSATFPPRIADLARRALKEPERVTVVPEKLDTPLVRQVAYLMPRQHKLEALARILDVEAPTSAIIFCRTRGEVDELTAALGVRGYHPEALHGGLAQAQRDRVMAKFRQGTADLLIATDVAARGLDVEHVSHVVNYDIPQTPEVYVHRIGRTARAGREGTALTLVLPRERFLLKAIERTTGQPFEHAKVPRPEEIRARRRGRIVDSVREALASPDELEAFRDIVRPLMEEFDPIDVAAAALRIAAKKSGTEEPGSDTEIPEFDDRGGQRTERFSSGGEEGRGPRGRRDRQEGGRTPAGKATLYIGIGRRRGIRPADIVGAIAGEARISGDRIGAIEIADQFTLVDVDEADADAIVEKLSKASIRGRPVAIRRSREDQGEVRGASGPPRRDYADGPRGPRRDGPGRGRDGGGGYRGGR